MGRRSLCTIGLAWGVAGMLAASARADEPVSWRIESAEAVPAETRVWIADQPVDALPEPFYLYQDPEKGPTQVSWEVPLSVGTYALAVQYRNPDQACHFDIRIDGRRQSAWETYRFDAEGATRTFELPFRVEETALHRIQVGIAPVTAAYHARFASRLPIAALSIAPYAAEPAAGIHASRPLCDLWGWLAAIDYQRDRAIDADELIRDVVHEPAQWGANFVQAYPHLWRPEWRKAWSAEQIAGFVRACHERGFLVDEHMGSDPKDAERAIALIHDWGREDGNLLAKGFHDVVDTWETEAIGYALVQSKDPPATAIRMNDALWAYHPGTPFNQCDQRPNTWQGGGAGWDAMDVYRGPNFIKTVMCANWCEVPGKPAIPVLAYTDMNPLRVFPGSLGLNDGQRDLFIGYQADCRLFAFDAAGGAGAIFGGGTTPDLILRQVDDMFRPRALEPRPVCESAIWWLGEPAATLPAELRSAVYAASMDPIRHAFTAALSATGFDGTLDRRLQVFSEVAGVKIDCPWWPHANEPHPASTAFVQNNHWRLLRYAEGDFGVVQWDPQHTAHFDSNSLAVEMAAGLSTEPASPPTAADAQKLVEVPQGKLPITTIFEARSEGGTLWFEFDQVKCAGDLRVHVDGRLRGRVRPGPGWRRLPIDAGWHGRHELRIEAEPAEGSGLRSIWWRASNLVRGESLIELSAADGTPVEPTATAPATTTSPASTDLQVTLDADAGLPRLPAQLGVDDPAMPRRLLIERTAEAGNYQLRLRGLSPAGCTLRIYRDGYIMVHPFAGDVPTRYKQGLCGELSWLPGRAAYHTVPIDFHFAGRHKLEIEITQGILALDTLELRPALVRHRWLERGGYRAVLEETLTRQAGGPRATEIRRYTADAGSPWLRVDLDRQGDPIDWDWRFDLRDYAELRHRDPALGIKGPARHVRMGDPASRRPDFIVLLPDRGAGARLDFQPAASAGIVAPGSRTRMTFYLMAPGIVPDRDLPAYSQMLGEPVAQIHLTRAGYSTAMRNRFPWPLTRTCEINDPDGKPYFVNEAGWWYARGGQPGQERRHSDYLSIRGEPGDMQLVQRWGYIDRLVRPGWGCQYVLALGQLERREDGAACTARVLSATPYLFAPRIEFAEPFNRVTLNGKPWLYHDERFVFLPTAPGDYRVEVSREGELPPRLICTSGQLMESQWDASAQTLELQIGLQPWTQAIPEGQRFVAMIRHAGRDLAEVQGAEIIEPDDPKLSPELRHRMRANGVALRFMPATPNAPDAGRIRVRFHP